MAPMLPEPEQAERVEEFDGMTRRERRRRRARVPGGDPRYVPVRKLIPNLLTAASLVAGMMSVYFSMIGRFDKAIIAILVSFILDGLDGRMARLLRVTTRFGEKFDSLADFTAFGIAPAVLLYQWELKELGIAGFGVVVLHVFAAAFRLARFTRQASAQKPGKPVAKFFQGCPAPAAGGAVLIPPMLQISDWAFMVPSWATAVWTVLIAALMVSRIPMISVKGWRVRRDTVGPLMLAAALIMVGLMREPWLTASGVLLFYLLTLPVSVIWHGQMKRAERARREAEILAASI